MSHYKVWDPDQGQSFEDSIVVSATSIRDAAESFAEFHAGFFEGDSFDELDVMVWDETAPDKFFKVTVDVEIVPNFCASYMVPMDRPPAVEDPDAVE